MMQRQKSSTVKKTKSASKSADSSILSSIFHAALFSYEQTLANTCSDRTDSLMPYLIAEFERVLPADIMGNVDHGLPIEKNVEILSEFIMTSKYFGSLDFSSESKNCYSLGVVNCKFARNGAHKLLRTSKNVCPVALAYAAFISNILGEERYAAVLPSDFDESSSYTRICIRKYEDGITRSSSIAKVDMQDYPLDSLDIDILRIIENNSRMTNVEIADALGTSEATVRRRIQTLLDDGIIRGFVTQIDHGRFRPKVRVHLAIDTSLDRMDEIAKKLMARPELCSLYRSIGEYNLVCELLMEDMKAVQGFIDDVSKTNGVIKINSMITTAPLKPCPWHGI